ncbi:TrkG protein [Aggregatibacter aphrophilus NJ8700]|nr:TrkG protein [Aggregatibacter aphrophilus NJ8700]
MKSTSLKYRQYVKWIKYALNNLSIHSLLMLSSLEGTTKQYSKTLFFMTALFMV